ncbi:MAG TPA: hypothetical protein VFL73_02930 [Solirubrobacteraceae bacterium]|nr:hypothetical protein [Solirubrobacteraceae bacterium]
MPDDTRPQLDHAPGCSDAEGTSTHVGHTVTVTRCLGCGAITTERHMGAAR